MNGKRLGARQKAWRDVIVRTELGTEPSGVRIMKRGLRFASLLDNLASRNMVQKLERNYCEDIAVISPTLFSLRSSAGCLQSNRIMPAHSTFPPLHF